MVDSLERDEDTSTIVKKKGRNPDRKRHGARNQHKMKHFVRWLEATFPTALQQASIDGGGSGHVLDVAGGKGELAARLCMCARKRVVLVDPRPAQVAECFVTRVLPQIPKKWQQNIQVQLEKDSNFVESALEERFHQIVGYLDDVTVTEHADLRQAIDQATLLIGMHADGATEAIVDVALEKNKPFCVVPCCVFPNLFRHRTIRGKGGEKLPVRSHEEFCQYLLEKDARLQQTTLPFEGRNTAIYFAGEAPSCSDSG